MNFANDCIIDVKPLSTVEYTKYKSLVSQAKGDWWLRTSGKHNDSVLVVDGVTGAVKECRSTNKYVGIRPALYLKDIGKYGVNVGDSLELGDRKFEVVDRNIAIPKDFISYGRFDQSHNDYDSSELKTVIDRWYKTSAGSVSVRNSNGNRVSDFDAEKLKALREQRGISVNRISSVLNINKNNYQAIEKGKNYPTEKQLQAIASYFRVDKNDLLSQNKKEEKTLTEPDRSKATEPKSKEPVKVEKLVAVTVAKAEKPVVIIPEDYFGEHDHTALSENELLAIKKIFTNNLHALLKSRDLTVTELSRLIDIPYYTITGWCNASKRNLVTKASLAKIAAYFKVKTTDIIPLKYQKYLVDSRKSKGKAKEQPEISVEVLNEAKALLRQNIKKIIREKNITQDDLAQAIGLHRATFRAWWNPNKKSFISKIYVDRMAQVLNISPEEIVPDHIFKQLENTNQGDILISDEVAESSVNKVEAGQEETGIIKDTAIVSDPVNSNGPKEICDCSTITEPDACGYSDMAGIIVLGNDDNLETVICRKDNMQNVFSQILRKKADSFINNASGDIDICLHISSDRRNLQISCRDMKTEFSVTDILSPEQMLSL